jgi:predicted O-linked N-acetylglucosamine transferase (SPINDLY family)
VSLPDVQQRIVFLPALSYEDFLSLVAVADVMLDPHHFSGMNSTLDAFCVGTPVVTLPTDLQRGRHTFGMYERMGIAECVAHSEVEYAQIAVRLASDSDFRRHVSQSIVNRRQCLFEDDDVVAGFASFFEAVCNTP